MRAWLLGGAALACAVVLAGCGGGEGWSGVACRTEASWLAERADAMVSHYSGLVYPADMSYLGFRDGLDRFEAGGCAPEVLGRELRRRLTPRRQSQFVNLLPAEIARSVRRALADAG